MKVKVSLKKILQEYFEYLLFPPGHSVSNLEEGGMSRVFGARASKDEPKLWIVDHPAMSSLAEPSCACSSLMLKARIRSLQPI